MVYSNKQAGRQKGDCVEVEAEIVGRQVSFAIRLLLDLNAHPASEIAHIRDCDEVASEEDQLACIITLRRTGRQRSEW
jgi:hypothetical protein